MDRHHDFFAETGQMLINRVVQHLKHTVMQTVLIRVADVHPRPLANRLQALQLVDLGGIILLATRSVRRFTRILLGLLGHGFHLFFCRHKRDLPAPFRTEKSDAAVYKTLKTTPNLYLRNLLKRANILYPLNSQAQDKVVVNNFSGKV